MFLGEPHMSTALTDLLFWIGAFVALFFLLRFLQKRKTPKKDD